MKTARCHWKLRYVPKFTAASHGTPCDSTAFLFWYVVIVSVMNKISTLFDNFAYFFYPLRPPARNIRCHHCRKTADVPPRQPNLSELPLPKFLWSFHYTACVYSPLKMKNFRKDYNPVLCCQLSHIMMMMTMTNRVVVVERRVRTLSRSLMWWHRYAGVDVAQTWYVSTTNL